MGQRVTALTSGGWPGDDAHCTQDHNVSIELLSEAFLGIPVKLRVKRAGAVTVSNDYFRISPSTWKWMSSSHDDDVFTLPSVEATRAGQDGEMLVIYYTNGGYLSRGTPIRSARFAMRNPLLSLTVALSSTPSAPRTVDCTAVLLSSAPSLLVTMSFDGVRVAEAPLQQGSRQWGLGWRQRSHQVSLPAPRVGGGYVVSVLTDRAGSSALDRQDIAVPAADVGGHFDVFLLSPSSTLHAETSTAAATKACIVVPGTSLRARCTGALQAADVLVLTEPHTSVKRLQAATHRFPVNAATGEAFVTVPQDAVAAGEVVVWQLVLGVRHPTGVILPAAYASIAVSPDATALPPPPPPPAPPSTHVDPTQPAPTTDSLPSREGTRFLCVICYDAVAVMKLDPCRHVCLCETCFAEVQRHADTGTSSAGQACPVCRAHITGHERVFLV